MNKILKKKKFSVIYQRFSVGAKTPTQYIRKGSPCGLPEKIFYLLIHSAALGCHCGCLCCVCCGVGLIGYKAFGCENH